MYTPFWGWYGYEWDIQNPETGAYATIQNGQQPSEEQRRRSSPPRAQAATTDMVNTREEDWEYREIPEEILGCGCASAWIGPTHKSVQQIIDAITLCFNYIEELGYIPFRKSPENMTDVQVNDFIVALNSVLDAEGRGWAISAGFTGPSRFSVSLDIEDKRTIAAIVQEAINVSGIRDHMKVDHNDCDADDFDVAYPTVVRNTTICPTEESTESNEAEELE